MSKKENLKAKGFFEVIEQLNNYDDRSLIIVGCAFVESSLTALLENNLKESVGTTKILSSDFSNKIELANSINLIRDREYKDLNCLRNLRNKFAHLMLLKSIDDNAAKQIIKNLSLSKMKSYKDNGKELLQITIVTLGIGLMLRDRKMQIDVIEKDVYDGLELFSESIGNAILDLNKWVSKVIEPRGTEFNVID